MTTAMQWLNRPCLQHDYAVCAHTMPFGLMKQDLCTRAGACHHVVLPISCFVQGRSKPISYFVQGRSMPIFRGGPPRSG
jgi:hypothetical protein